jgi:hypothetical protein
MSSLETSTYQDRLIRFVFKALLDALASPIRSAVGIAPELARDVRISARRL